LLHKKQEVKLLSKISIDRSHSEQPLAYIAENLHSHKTPTLKPQNLIFQRIPI